MGRGKRQACAQREISLSDTVRAPKRVPTWDFSPPRTTEDSAGAELVEALCRFRTLVGQGKECHDALGQAVREVGADPAASGRLDQALLDILDKAAAESYDAPEVEGASDLEWNELADLAQSLIDEQDDAVVSCNQCQQPCSADLAHYLPGDQQHFIVGDSCCWDERLRQ